MLETFTVPDDLMVSASSPTFCQVTLSILPPLYTWIPSAPLLPMMTLRRVAPFSTRKTGFWLSLRLPSRRPLPALLPRQPPSSVPLVPRMVEFTVVEPLGEQDAPVIPPELPPDELLEPPPEEPLGCAEAALELYQLLSLKRYFTQNQ